MPWFAWALISVVSALGFRRFSVDNSIDAWTPDLISIGPTRSYVVVGFNGHQIDANAVALALRRCPATRFCIDTGSVLLTTSFTGVTPENFVIGTDPAYRGVFCFRKDNVSDRDFLSLVVKSLSQVAPADRFALAGPAVFKCAMDEWSQRRMVLILTSIVACGCIMLVLITGSLRIAISATAAICMSQIAFAGVLSWLRRPFDMSIALVPPMMMGLGFSYAAHRALRRRSLPALLACGIAAATGIGSFATEDSAVVQHFAVAGVFGLAVVWLATVMLIHPDPAARRRRCRWLRGPRNACLLAVRRWRRSITVTGLLVTLGGFAAAPLLRIEANPLNFFPAESNAARDFALLNTKLTGMLPSVVTVSGDADPQQLLKGTPGMRKVIDISHWTDTTQRTYLCLADNNAVEELARQAPLWQTWAAQHHVTLKWLGVAAQIHRSSASLMRTAAQALPTMAAVIAAMVYLLLRRIRFAFLAAWTCIAPVSATILVAIASAKPLGPVSFMIGSIIAGVAVDDTLQLLLAARRRRSMRKAQIECWKPCVGSSLTTALCFGLFMISPFGPTAQFGELMALATVLAMIANQCLLTASFGGTP